MRQLASTFLFFFTFLTTCFSQNLKEITPLSSLYLPHILASDSVDVQGNAYSTATLLQSSPIATKQQANATRQQSSEDGFFYPQEQTLQGRGKVDSYFFAVHASRYGKGKLSVYTSSRIALFQDGQLLGSSPEPLASDSTVAIEVEVTLYAGENPFYLKQLVFQEDTTSCRFRVHFEPADSTATDQFSLQQGLPDLLTPSYMNRGTFMYGVSLSPSGRYLLASYYTLTDGKTDFSARLYDSKGATLAQGRQYVSARWLSDRDRLYYVHQEGDTRRLYTSRPDGSDEELWIASLPSEGNVFELKGRLFIYQENSGTPPDDKIHFVLDPDDRMPGWRNNSSLYEIDPETSQLTQLTFGKGSLLLTDISPEGKLLFINSHKSWVKNPYYFNHLLLFDPSTGIVDTLAREQLDLRHAQFAKGGKQLYILGSPNSFDGVGRIASLSDVGNGYEGEIYSFDLDTRRATPLTKAFAPSVTRIKMDQQGGLYFVAEEGSRIALFAYREGRGIERLATSESYIKDFSVSADGKAIAYMGQSATNGDRLKLLAGKRERTLWDLDAEKMVGYLRPEVRDFAYTYHDGTNIEAWYCLPPHFDREKKYPLLVYYYGGTSPTQRYMEGRWSPAMFASEGYVVLVLNPSGTTGYGQEFAARHINAWGEPTGSEIIACVEDFAEKHSFINEAKIGCFGASYGGFMTQYLVSKTDLFAAAISHAGISSISNYWGSGYWGMGYSTVASYGSYPWNRPDIYVKQSPLFRADKINTPLLLLHGDSDTNVPLAESVNLYNALKVLDRDVALITFGGEDHGIQDVGLRIQWTYTMLAWFAKYLQDDPTWWQSLYGTEN